ncbi:hypothetical protein EV356DRAFT_99548 [Viridothelium virens]|uniref:Uncharacterized protein n=1 Tax=Viridothelium virens TaxID=1048519 RepID=A0A6A6HMR7_VIRVR|nr:hypothetical protein EV356DRAFT_99548 [Viridothelium virens]
MPGPPVLATEPPPPGYPACCAGLWLGNVWGGGGGAPVPLTGLPAPLPLAAKLTLIPIRSLSSFSFSISIRSALVTRGLRTVAPPRDPRPPRLPRPEVGRPVIGLMDGPD